MQKNEELQTPAGSGNDAPHTEMEELANRLENHEERLKKIEHLLATRPRPSTKPTSIREFILEKQPKSDVEKTFVIGYFLERNRNLTSFNTQDLSDGFREAKETVPANVNLAALKNVQKGYFMEAKEKKDGLKAWTLTNSGMSSLERSPAAT